MQKVVVAELTQATLNELYADLKCFAEYGGTMEVDAFRYEMFARRLIDQG